MIHTLHKSKSYIARLRVDYVLGGTSTWPDVTNGMVLHAASQSHLDTNANLSKLKKI